MARRLARGGRSGISIPPRQRSMDWARATSGALVTVPVSSKVILASFTEATGIDVTVRRSVGMLFVQSDQSAAQEVQAGAFGMCVVNGTAAALGVTAIPGPVTDDDDELWGGYLGFVAAGEAGTEAPISGIQYPFDFKAMRKIPGGSFQIFIIENASSAAALEVMVSVSSLVSH